MIVHLDESGDLGWKFDAPYRQGGSSRYLTIAMTICPKAKKDLPKRMIIKLRKKLKIAKDKELKASDLSNRDRTDFAMKTVTLLEKHQDIKIAAITVKKENVMEHIRNDPNKLYNFMIRLILLDHIKMHPVVDFVPDKRAIKVASGNSLADYLQTELWMKENAQTKITDLPQESHMNRNLQFADFMANFIWRKYELNHSGAFNKLRTHIDNRSLYF
ncbi:MAG: DUF3800 domain-containing protein [Pseudodesulfovibrio sp.]|nr:DUF3800 domain-containing protein [Pseudodesulfovibrio sp.]